MIRRLLIAAAIGIVVLSVLSTTAVEMDWASAGVVLGVMTLGVPAGSAAVLTVTVAARILIRAALAGWRRLRRAQRTAL